MHSTDPASHAASATPQMGKWAGEFGRAYTDRNNFSVAELDAAYVESYGISRTDMAGRLLAGVPREARVLEIGCNVGMALRGLQNMGFRHLYGIELQSYAVEKAKALGENINIIQGSAFDVPFKDGYFDLVFTSGVLIHISPQDLPAVRAEIHRCSARYIWGFEDYAETITEVNYRGNGALLWKGDYATSFLTQFPDLKMIRKELFPYRGQDIADCGYLLEKEPVAGLP